MVKTNNSGVSGPSLKDVVEQLKSNNRLVDESNQAMHRLLDEAKSAREASKKQLVADNRQEALSRKSQLEASKEAGKGNGIRGRAGRMAASAATGLPIGGMFGAGMGIGAAASGLARLGARGLTFGAAGLALNELAQGALDRVFDDVDPKSIGFENEGEAKARITGGMNISMGMKFLGFRGRTSLLTGIGVAFGDQITGWISDKMGADKINMPGWVEKTFGLNPNELQIDLTDKKTSAAIGAAVTLIGTQILLAGAKVAALRTGRGLKNLVKKAPPGASQFNNPNKAIRKEPPVVKPPAVVTNAPKLSTSQIKPTQPATLGDFADDLKAMRGTTVGKLYMPNSPGARPMVVDPTSGQKKFASVAQVKAELDANKLKRDLQRKVLVAEKRYNAKVKNGGMMKTALSNLKNGKGVLGKTLKVGGKALAPVSFAYGGYLGYGDQERKAAGQSASQRIAGGIVEDAGATVDMLVDGLVMLPNMLANSIISPFTDYRFKTSNVTGGAVQSGTRKGSFLVFDKVNEEIVKLQEKHLVDLKNVVGPSHIPGQPIIIDNSTGGTNINSTSFSNNAPVTNTDPYSAGYMR